MNDRSDSVAVIGTGPVGLALALRLADAGAPVTAIESGPLNLSADRHDLGYAEIADPLRHAPMALSARRGYGGTSKLWGGRTVPLDPIDFAKRDWVDAPDWPVDYAAVRAHYPAACAFLNCGPAEFGGAGGTGHLSSTHLERWCAQPYIGRAKFEALRKHPKIAVLSGATATQIVIDPGSGRAEGVVLWRDGRSETVRFQAVVVAAGGVESARLLLNSRTAHPGLFGGENGPLGRTYMGHIYGSIADIVFDAEGADHAFDYRRDNTGHYWRRRFALDAGTQETLRVLNMAAWPETPAIADARHRSAVLSMGYLALAMPVIGPRLAPPAIRARKLAGGDGRVWPHIANVLGGPLSAARFAASFGAARYLSRIRKPGFFVLNAARRYSFFYHGEHAPHRDSRVTLSSARDETGMFRVRIDLRFHTADAESVVATHSAMDLQLRAQGLAHLEYLTPEAEHAASVLAQANDGFHQIGTARMSDDPRDGVTDGDGRVHGIANLFVAGSALFPTSGHANPTLTAVALALRQADVIAQDWRNLRG